MSSRITITHNERTGEPIYVDVFNREPAGPLDEYPRRTYRLEPGEARTVELRCNQVFLLRNDPPRAPGAEVLQGA